MRRVSRPSKPDTLVDNADCWKQDLLEQISLKGSYSKVDDKFKTKYKADDVSEALKSMYSNLCCFCESTLGLQTYERIEHLKPKSKFPELSFEWDNLNLVCEICNTSYKKDKWDSNCPFLDPSAEDINNFLKLNLISGEYEPVGDNERAIYTIEHTGLNRNRLVEKRKQIIDYCTNLSFLIDKKELTDDIQALKLLMGYPTTYQTIIDGFR